MIKRVAYQGVTGSFSSMAARALFGTDIAPVETRRFREIFEHVAAGRAEAGVVPLENALAGSVQENYDLLSEFECRIVAEYYCPVQLHLMAVSARGATPPTLEAIQKVISHPKALEQCSQFLESRPGLVPVVHSDTAGAAQLVRDSADPTVAAIASEEAATSFGLTIIARSVQNHSTNSTRFVAIARSAEPSSCANKCSLVFTLPHRPGSLHAVLGKIAGTGMNVTKIESRPILGRPFEYTFHLDIETEVERSEELARLAGDLASLTAFYRVLGVYTAASNG